MIGEIMVRLLCIALQLIQTSQPTKECHADQSAHLFNSANHAGVCLSLPCTVACSVNISKICTTLFVVCTEMKVQPHHADATAEEAALRR